MIILKKFYNNNTIATESIHVSSISHATFRSDSVNSYFLAHPRGVYLILSWTIAWSQANRKYSLDLSLGAYKTCDNLKLQLKNFWETNFIPFYIQYFLVIVKNW